MKLPLLLVGQTIRDADGAVIVSALNPCSDTDKKVIVEYVNGYAELMKAGGVKTQQEQENPKRTIGNFTNRFDIGDPDEECAPPDFDPRLINTCLRCGKEFDPHDHINIKVYDRKLDGTWGISHYGCWFKAKIENQVLHRKIKDNSEK